MYEQNSNFYRTQEVCLGTSENEMITADETSGFFDEFNYMTCKKSSILKNNFLLKQNNFLFCDLRYFIDYAMLNYV